MRTCIRQAVVLSLVAALTLGWQSPAQAQADTSLLNPLRRFVAHWMNGPQMPANHLFHETHGSAHIDLDTAYADALGVHVFFGKSLADRPIRPATIEAIEQALRTYLPQPWRQKPIHLYSQKHPLAHYIPNAYRPTAQRVAQRNASDALRPKRRAIVQRVQPTVITAGLQSANLALWNSHGWYYESDLDRWEWQRARLFTTVEDLLPTAFVVPFLAPMLEGAGATVFVPRERDWSPTEVLVDNDPGSHFAMQYPATATVSASNTGFALGTPPYDTQNPFRQGTWLQATDSVVYPFELHRAEELALYVAYGPGKGVVEYRITVDGGTERVRVDQTAGAGTWIYLGRYRFAAGPNRIVLRSAPGQATSFSADAIRLGGGLGLVQRNGQTSQRAKFYEAARYYLQYAGAPDTLVWRLNANDDYADDYQGRGEWVNWLVGAPFGPTRDTAAAGLGIPIDLAFAFHTDAGALPRGKNVGTLAIFSSGAADSLWANGQSRWTSRDLSDLVQTQIVDDTRALFDSTWMRRGLWNKGYSEAFRPKVPTMLLELLSHQNYQDMRLALQPQYRFGVARAIYKGMLRYLAHQHGYAYVVQPLPVQHMACYWLANNKLRIEWKATPDPLEPTAQPTHYLVQQRLGQGAFVTVASTTRPSIELSDLQPDRLYSYRVLAANDGGVGFASDVLTAAYPRQSVSSALLVQAFDRTDAPALFDTDSLSGFVRYLDEGVAYGYDLLTTGDQYDFSPRSPWLDDDAPGHGASFANLETQVRLGNTFDQAATHAQALLRAGYRVCTSSDEAFEQSKSGLEAYSLIDLIFGEEKTTHIGQQAPQYAVYTGPLLDRLQSYTRQGGALLLSGAYIGTELAANATLGQRAEALLGFKHRTNHAVRTGTLVGRGPTQWQGSFRTQSTPEGYGCEAPDAIEPANKQALTLLRYTENNTSAAVGYRGKHRVVALGFPLECIEEPEQLDALLAQLLAFLTAPNTAP